MNREELAGLVCNTIRNGLNKNPSFSNQVAADCFCESGAGRLTQEWSFEFNQRILEAIEEALATVEFPPQEDFDA